MTQTKNQGTANIASAKGSNLAISTKHSIEISHHLRYRSVSFAKHFLASVMTKRSAVPFRRFNRDMGHKPGMAAGRYPIKAASEFLRLLKSVEKNAQAKGLNSNSLKITKIVSNKASIPAGGGRHGHGTKRTHIEIQVQEVASKKRNKNTKKSDVKKEVVKETPADKKAEDMVAAAKELEAKAAEPKVSAQEIVDTPEDTPVTPEEKNVESEKQ